MSVIPRSFSVEAIDMHRLMKVALPSKLGKGVFEVELVDINGQVAVRGYDEEDELEFLEFRYRGPYGLMYAGWVYLDESSKLSPVTAIEASLKSVEGTIERAKSEFLRMYDQHTKNIADGLEPGRV
jgi:hypothetical protein